MADHGSVILSSLGEAFGEVLKKDIEREELEDKKKDKEQKQKKTKKSKKKDEKKEEKKPKREMEEKHVVREGKNSFITHPNASAFTVFSHIRHLVLQTRLCETYNSRISLDSGVESEEEEEEEGQKDDSKKMPVVVGIGVKGVFTIIQEIWRTHPELCLRALREFLNILQGQKPAGLKNEPKETTDSLFELLMQMVSEPVSSENQLAVDLSSVASACLLSLVVALGDTGKMLSAVAAMLTAPAEYSVGTVQIPQIFYTLQSSVQAVLIGAVVDIEWPEQGVPSKSLVERWSLSFEGGDKATPEEKTGSESATIASDGKFLYVHGVFGLVKAGSGYGNTKKGLVYKALKDFHVGERSWLGYSAGKLYYFPLGEGADIITIIDTDSLSVEGVLELDADSLGPQCLFADSEGLGQIKAKKEGGFVIRKFTTLSSPLVCFEEKNLQLSQKSVLVMGRAKYDSQTSLHTIYQDSLDQAMGVMASRNFAAIQTSSGKLLYTGSGSVFGISSKDIPRGEWKQLELPDKNVKVEHCSCDNSGTFCLIVSDKGTVYFGGLNKKGEAAEAIGGGRHQPKPMKLKRIAKLKDHQIVRTACGSHATAMISKDDKLFMFGNLEDDITDKSTGIVTDLLGVPVSQVCMGRSHTSVLTQHGTVYTFGSNTYGQCGRNFVPAKFDAAAVEEEDDSSSEEEEGDMCPQGEHKWAHNVCMVCRSCGYCTGYGPGCCNEGVPGRNPGSQCGCGSGDSGCTECGCCRVCAGEKDRWGGGFQFGDELEEMERIEMIREKVKKKKEKKKEKKEKKEDKSSMGLQLLFGGQLSVEVEESVAKDEASAEPPALTTKKPALVSFPDELTAMQVDCGTFHSVVLLHSGEVYAFGNGNHGQLGQGNTNVCGQPVKVPLPETATQIACGDNHTVILLQSGEVWTFGKHQEGQLGRKKEEGDDDTWNSTPRPISNLGDGFKATWIGASGNQTFIAMDESLVSETSIRNCKVFANSQTIGLVPSVTSSSPNVIMINRQELRAKKFDGEGQQDLSRSGVCIDPEYNVLWSYSPQLNKVACFNPIAANIENSAGTIVSSSICLPRSKEAQTSRSHMAVNLLSCLSTLATHPPLTMETLAGSKLHKYDKEEFNCVVRFNAHGGGWGYSASSVEAIRFSPDTDILLGGYGLYGGRGSYNAEIKVFDLGESGGENETEGTLIAAHSEVGYTCERQQTCRVLFDKPVLLAADNWYVAFASISSPSGASSDAGSSGQSEVQGADKVVFKIKSSKRSNNGTDIGSGQIPEILYRIPEIEKENGVQIQLLEKEFSSTVSPIGLNAVLRLLDWSWSQVSQALAEESATRDHQHLAFVAKAALGLLKTYIRGAYPKKKRKTQKGSLDCPELAEAIFEARTLLRLILSSRKPLLSQQQQLSDIEEKLSPLTLVMEACCDTFRACFHAFYPTTPLKWFALCQQLELLDPHDAVSGVPMENLLSAILEALAEPAVSYIGLGYDTTISINAAIYNSEPDPVFPVLSEHMQLKTLEENDGGELLGFNAVAAKLLGIVTAPIHSALVTKQPSVPVSPVVSKAGSLLQSRISELALCIAYPDSTLMSGLPLVKSEKKERVLESSVRFSTKESGHPVLSVPDVVFSVNKPILLHGVTIYGGTDSSYKYKMCLLRQAQEKNPVAITEGSFSSSDYYGESFVNLLFKEPVKIEPEVVYTAHLELTGTVFDIGVEGKTSLTGPAGVTFSLHHTGEEESNPESGPITKFMFTPSTVSGSQNVVHLNVHLASTLLEVTVGFLERVIREGPSPDILDILGSSFLFSTLLPTTLAQLGPVACKQPKYAVEVLDLVKRTLPVISAAAQSAVKGAGKSDESSVYSDTKLLHYATVETEHPYKQATVTHFKIKFTEKVQWMSLEFDPRSGFSQKEDKIGELLIPRRSAPPTYSSYNKSTDDATVTSSIIGVGVDDLYAEWDRYALDFPPGLVLLPGNEVHIALSTDTEYEKKDANNHYGLKCQAVGYEWTNNTPDCLLLLEKELVALGAMCASSMLKEDTILPFAEELSVSGNPGDSEKADMRIVQAAAQEVLNRHNQVLCRGLMVDTPTIHNILAGGIPVITSSNEQTFLKDFIESKADTTGGRLARWLQPDRAVDPEASELVLPVEPVQAGVTSEFTICTKDQDGKPVYVEGMKVEVKAVWLGRKGGQEGETPHRNKMVDSVMGVRRPTFKNSYHPTRLNTNYLYHSISMMMHYSDYSFEELRLFAPKVEKSAENIPLKPNDDGTYVASWVPSTSGQYLIQIFIDGRSTGQEKPLDVAEQELAEEEEADLGDDEMEEQTGEESTETKKEEETPPTLESQESQSKVDFLIPKMKLFSGKTAKGVRIRSEPSLTAKALGVINPGDRFTYSEQVDNDAGTWVVLTPDAIEQLKCNSSAAYALSYSKERKQEFLEEVEPLPEEIEKLKKQFTTTVSSPSAVVSPKKPISKKRQGGPGPYQVVQCGTAGHNVRSKPGLKGTPVGRLAKGNKIDAIEEVENDDGIWLKLSKESTKKYSDGDGEAWTLAVGPSGRIFLALDNDDSYLSQIIDTKAPPPKPNVFPTAAQVFGTSNTSVFGTPLSEVPSVFNFGSRKPVKIQFGSKEPVKLEFGGESPQGLFKFGSTSEKEEEKKKDNDDDKKAAEGPGSEVNPLAFSIGSKGPPKASRMLRRARKKSSSPVEGSKKEASKEESKEEEDEADGDEVEVKEPKDPEPEVVVTSPTIKLPVKQALSPAVAECQRAIFAAFLWQEGLVYDAMASASYLKFNPGLMKEVCQDATKGKEAQDKTSSEKDGEEDKKKPEEEPEKEPEKKPEEAEEAKDAEKESEQPDAMKSSSKSLTSLDASSTSTISMLPPTLSHLVTFWDEISCKVIENASLPFPAPKVPVLAEELQKRYEEEKKEIEKRKKEKDKKVSVPAGGGGGATICELCDQSFPDPVTYHMKEMHPGCGKHASGWGYNSRGTFCSGWAGNCGDGGRGGSTWYLMCKACHSKYLAMKDEAKKKSVKTVPMPKMKTRKPGKPRTMAVISSVQGMIQNARFLLEISRASDSAPTTPSTVKPPNITELLSSGIDYQRQVSTPDDKTGSLPRTREKHLDPSEVFDSDRPSFNRSVSVIVGGSTVKRTQSDSGGEDGQPGQFVLRQRTMDESTTSEQVGSFLMAKPSKNLRKLMYNRSRRGSNKKETGYHKVMAFVLRYHDLDGLRVSMKQAMRVAGIRTFALEFLEWLLTKVQDPSVIHDVLWQFNCALTDNPVQQMASKVKAEREKGEKGQKNDKPSESEDWFLGKHPLTGLDGAGAMLQMLRKQFHSFLQTTANIMPKLPAGSTAQQVALQCYCLRFQPQDHSFLLQSNVFANISQALSLADDSQEGTTSAQDKKALVKDTGVDVSLMENILSKGRLRVSSNEAMLNSLTDGSTETFWESRDEPRGRPRQLNVTFEGEKKVFAVAVHIDNQKDAAQRVESVTLLVGRDEDSLKEVYKAKLSMMHTGWKTLIVPGEESCSILRVEVKGLQNNVRVRQIQVLGFPNKCLDTTYLAVVAQQKACEAEALRVFRLLTSQVFGGFLSADTHDETDSPTPSDGDKEEEVRDHVVDILFSKGKLSGLQKQVCVHIMQSVHSETMRMKEEWEVTASKQTPSKPNRQQSSEPSASVSDSGATEGSDTYCYELLTMMFGLCQSEAGCGFLSEQESLVQDLFILLHVATMRIQLQVCSLLRKILPVIGPKNLATMLTIKVLPPLGYSAIAEAVNSAATINQHGLLDCLLAIIAKALSVQVKAKGRSTNILQVLTGESSITALTLACLVNPKPVPGETTVKPQRWYLKGDVTQEVAGEVIKLLKDMSKGSLGAQWEGYAKSAIGQAVLHLTKVNEEARVPIPGMYSQTLWLCLAALCVIDEEHAEALSSGQWLGQDGKPKNKPLCDNHDDGETQALILCDKCGNLCGECDRVLHYKRATKNHQRQVFKEEEEAVKVELHEGCGRIKLYWTMALADYRTLKGMIEFRESGSGGGKGACRFCGTTSNTSLLAIGNVCADSECLERADTVCDTTLSCGHACCGVKGEETCLPCLNGCAGPDAKLKQDADDMCMICYTEGLSCAACVQLECGHVFHYHCCRNALTKRWSGPRITFRFMFCSICVNTRIGHSQLADVLDPVVTLYDDVKRKCLMRLEYENLTKCEAITTPSSKFYQKPYEYAMWKYAYYVCHKCKKAYYGGEAHCAEQASASDDYDPTELVCPACSNVAGAVQVCPKHGTDFLEYKCRYCCSVAVYFCFGTTHFCGPCHDDFQRLTSMAKSELPQCPVGPSAKPLEGTECPLHVKHPPTGEEFALGCGVCRNAQTF